MADTRPVATRINMDLYNRLVEYAVQFQQPSDAIPPVGRALRSLIEDVLYGSEDTKSAGFKRGYRDGFFAGKQEAFNKVRAIGNED